jgi:hypothetical protein
MLRSRIDPGTLDEISDIPCEVLAYAGSATAHWFLLFKNVIASQPHPPRWTIVFFRDQQLTMPAFRAGGRYRNGIEECMRDDEPQFTSILSHVQHDSKRWTDRLATAVYLLQRKRMDWQDAVQRGALKAVANRSQRSSVREAAARIFSSKNLRTDPKAIDAGDGERLDSTGHEFQANVGQSFLPLMLEIARERNTRLLFFRVKCRPRSRSSSWVDRPDLQKYQRELRAYLASHEAVLVDETTDPDVTIDYYGGDDHVRDEMMTAYTELFWRKVRPLLDWAVPAKVPPAVE